MDETEIVKFNKSEAEVRGIVAETSGIVEVDIENKEEIKKVKEARIRLRDLRNDIKDFGKNKRDWFNKMASKIIEAEKSLVAIIEPEEKRLASFEDEFKKKKEIADRLAVLPQRREQLEKIEDGIIVTDEFIISMNADDFMGYCNKRIADKNQKIADDLKAREDEIKRKEDKIKHDQEIKDAEEKARKDEKEKAIQDEKDRIEREANEGKRLYELKLKTRIESVTLLGMKYDGEAQSYVLEDFNVSVLEIKVDSDSEFAVKLERIGQEMTRRKEEARQKKEQEEMEAKQKAEQEALEKEKDYKDWLASVGYDESKPEQFYFNKVGNKIELYKLVGTYENNA